MNNGKYNAFIQQKNILTKETFINNNIVRPLSRTFRLDLTWAHNLFVWWAWISYLGSFSTE